MKTNFTIAVVILGINLFFFCNAPSRITNSTQPNGVENPGSAQWEGNYRGIMPCAECAGIQTTVSLNSDMTYSIRFKHLDKSDSIIEHSGKFELIDKGNTVVLKDPQITHHVLSYHIGENVLTLVDAYGNDVNYKRQDSYTLSKANYDIVGKHWKLVELNGIAVQIDSSLNKQPEIIFYDENNKMTGNGGCNNISGSYKLGNTEHISFSNIISTQIACSNSSLETKFLKVLSKVENYYVTYDQLVLCKTKSTPLARFRAVE
jgi:copper homeostasis protein (lipoprotein)